MRGENETQGHMFTYLSPEQRVPKDHPLRSIKESADQVLKELSTTFRAMYSRVARPSVPPERLLKAQVLIAPCTPCARTDCSARRWTTTSCFAGSST
jgi:hypothetical protein